MDKRNIFRGYAFMTVPRSSLDSFLSKEVASLLPELFINKAQRKTNQASLANRIFFMKDLLKPTPLDPAQVTTILESFGEIEDIYFYKNYSGKTKGYGFCDFKQTGLSSRFLKIKYSETANGQRIYYHRNKDSIKKRVFLMQKKVRRLNSKGKSS